MLYATPGNWLKKCGFGKHAIHNSNANGKIMPFALKILWCLIVLGVVLVHNTQFNKSRSNDVQFMHKEKI